MRGLQVNLDTGAVSFSGVSVDFEIPGVLIVQRRDRPRQLASAGRRRGRRPAVELPCPGRRVRRRRRRHDRGGRRPRDRRPVHRRPQGRSGHSSVLLPRARRRTARRDPAVPRRRAVRAVGHVREQPAARTSAATPGGTGTSTRPPPTAPRTSTAPPTCRATTASRTSPPPTSFKWLNPVAGALRARRRGGHRHPGRRLHRVGLDRLHPDPARTGDHADRQGEHPLAADQRARRGGQLRGDGDLRRQRRHVRPRHRGPVLDPGRLRRAGDGRAVRRSRRCPCGTWRSASRRTSSGSAPACSTCSSPTSTSSSATPGWSPASGSATRTRGRSGR